MWKIEQPQPGRRSFDFVAALNVLATSERHRLSALIPRMAFVLMAIVAVDELIAGTGGLPSYYSYFFMVLLMYAGLVLPMPLALGVTAIAVAGPSHRGLLFTQGLQNNESTVLLRPLALAAIVTLAWVIGRVIRRNVSFYEQLYASIAAHFPNGTITLFDNSLRFLISGGEGLTQIGLTPEQIVGKGPWDIFDAQSLEAELPAMHAALAGQASAFEMKFEGRDRLIRMTPVRDGSGKVVAGLSISQDITELRQAEATIRASEQRMFSFLESMPVGVFVLDAGGKPFYVNDLAERLLGRGVLPTSGVEELTEVYRAFVVGTDDIYPAERSPIARALFGETSMIEDMEIARPDGRIRLQVWGAPIRDEDGQITHAVAAFSDITAQKRFEEAVRESEERFRAVFEKSPLGIFLVDSDVRFIRVNEALCQITGYGSDELLGRRVSEITLPDDVDVGLEQRDLLASGELTQLNVEKRYVRKDGRVIWVSVYSCAILDTKGVPIHWLAMAEDITARREMEAAVQHLADHDPLTGLPNRRLMCDRMEQAITRTRRYGGEIAILSIDLNDFKNVNDEFGHVAGDALLVEISRRLESAIRESDTAARMGGDEFLVLLSEASAADVEAVRLRITGALALPVVYEGQDIFTPASIGVATYGLDGGDIESLLKAADAAMYADKEAHGAEPDVHLPEEAETAADRLVAPPRPLR